MADGTQKHSKPLELHLVIDSKEDNQKATKKPLILSTLYFCCLFNADEILTSFKTGLGEGGGDGGMSVTQCANIRHLPNKLQDVKQKRFPPGLTPKGPEKHFKRVQ